MNETLLIVTHLGCAFLGAAVCRAIMKRNVTVCEVHGHPAIEFHHAARHQEEPTIMSDQELGSRRSAFVLIAVGVMALVIGIQVYVGVSDAQDRADENAARDRADRIYADCLTKFAGDLVETIETRVAAGATVVEAQKARDQAEQARDEAVDEVIQIVARARQVPPKATAEELDAALARVGRARDRLDDMRAEEERVIRAESKVLRENQYQMPKAVCMR